MRRKRRKRCREDNFDLKVKIKRGEFLPPTQVFEKQKICHLLLHFLRTMCVSELRCFGFALREEVNFGNIPTQKRVLLLLLQPCFFVIWQNPQQSDFIIKDRVWLPRKKQSNNIIVIPNDKQLLLIPIKMSNHETVAQLQLFKWQYHIQNRAAQLRTLQRCFQ